MPGFKEPNPMSTNQMGQGELDETKTIHQLDAKNKTLIIPVDRPELSQLPEETEIDKKPFNRKPEFHITAVSFTKAKEIKAALKEKPELEEELNQIIANLNWEQLILQPEIFHIQEDKEITRQLSKKEKKDLRTEGKEAPDSVVETIHREAIIQMADLPAMQELYQKAAGLGIDLGEVPPVHITLYTYGDPSGIAINSQENFDALNPKETSIDNKEQKENINFDYNLLDPRINHPKFKAQALANNAAIFEKGNVMGVEVTVPQLAEQCQLGNIDPQHSEQNSELAAIEVAQTMDLPEQDATLVTLRADMDSVGAMAVLNLRKEGLKFDEEAMERLSAIAESDKTARGSWPGQQELPTREQLWTKLPGQSYDPETLAPIAALVADHKVPLEEKVNAVRLWLTTGENPANYKERVIQERLSIVEGLENGDIKIEISEDKKITIVESTHRASTGLGYTQSPVVISLNPSFSFQGGEPIVKYTISQFEEGYIDMQAALEELNDLENGWGGSKTIGGSPQGQSSELPKEKILEIVKKHLK